MMSASEKWLRKKRDTVNRNIDRTEVMIMELLREGIDPTDYIIYRESLKSRAHDIHEELMEII